MKRKGSAKGKRPKRRAPVAPPGFVMGKTRYHRSSQKKAREEELEQYFSSEKKQADQQPDRS